MNAYTEAKKFIEDATDKDTLYSGLREILSKDMAHYPEDWQVKTLQRLADAKYEQLNESLKMQANRVQQGNYFSVLYDGEYTETIIETQWELEIGNRYSLNGKAFTVKSKKNFKYTLEDIDDIRVLTEGYEYGIGKDICEHMLQPWKRKIPNVHFSREEKEFLSCIYHENEYISDKDRSVLEKVLDIEPVNNRNLRRKGR